MDSSRPAACLSHTASMISRASNAICGNLDCKGRAAGRRRYRAAQLSCAYRRYRRATAGIRDGSCTFGSVLRQCSNELAHADSPPLVRAFATHKPPWLDVHPDPSLDISELTDASLDEGERAAIALAKSIAADLILMDDRAGATVARQLGFLVTDTLGILDLAAGRGLIHRRTPDLSTSSRRNDARAASQYCFATSPAGIAITSSHRAASGACRRAASQRRRYMPSAGEPFLRHRHRFSIALRAAEGAARIPICANA
jgi:predicted nucleic acid-binding protein